MDNNQRTLGVVPLTFFAIGLTLASGIFSLSGDFAAGGAHTLAVLIGWVICGIGMLGLTMCFFRLSVVKPELASGIYSYAREGFGDYIGFNAAWGYWMSAILAQISFITLFFAALGHFFSLFGSGSNGASMICASVIIWAMSFMILRGVNEAVVINVVVVCAKILPIIVMVVAIIFAGAFNMDTFMENFTGEGSGIPLIDQIKATSYTTVWIFIGIEGAVVISGRAKTTKLAGRATVISFLSLLALYIVISVLSMGVMTTEELAALENPPMAGLLASVVGPWGAALVNIAVIISLGGAMFTYTILCVDSAYGPATMKCFPESFTKVNSKNAPTISVILSAIIIQIFIIIVYINESSFQACYTLSTSAIMVPYVFSAFYCFKVTAQGVGMDGLSGGEKTKVWLFAILGSIYGVWLLYASGLTYILVMSLLYFPGTLLYFYTKKKQGARILATTTDKVAFAILLVAFIASVVTIANGTIHPF